MPEDLINRVELAETLRYCPQCDPRIDYPVRTEPRLCYNCGTTLVVVTPWSRPKEDKNG